MTNPSPTTTYAVPDVDPRTLTRFLEEEFGLTGRLEPLPGERDRNFRLETADGERFVVKVANGDEDPATLAMQSAALQRIAARAPDLAVPAVRQTLRGEPMGRISSGTRGHWVRVVTWIEGIPLAEVEPVSADLLRSLGTVLATIHDALEGYHDSAARRPLKWDLGQAAWIESHWDRIENPDQRTLARSLFRPYAEQVAPRWSELPAGIIHGDANDHNVIVSAAGPDRRVVTIVDYGDMVHSARVGDLAIAIGYGILDLPDPLAGAAAIVEGYASVRALTDAELAALYPLVLARLAVSVVNSAVQRGASKADDYLYVSEAAAWRLLTRLESVHPRFATYRLRAAAGVEPVPESPRVVRWIERSHDQLVPVIAVAEGILPPRVDLSIGSEFLDDFRLLDDEPALTRKISAVREETGARVAVGEYDEPRLFYTSELFRTEGWEGSEWRTVHIGLDLFTGSGCPVRSPLAGRVVGVRNNAGPGDYGPTVIVQHDVSDEDGPFTFYTLYGHLDTGTLTTVFPGQPVAAGATIGRLGNPQVNGGWSPHLHFQLVVDLLDREGEFPGVARPSERAVWTSLSPAPHSLASIPDTRRAAPASLDAIRERRRRVLGGNLSIAYRRPLHLVRGWMQYLYDAEGRRYLDAVNNVPHVGHCHPRVVGAGRRQMAVLNTNTRYLHETVIRYGERLTQLLPAPLSVCYFVNSGTEANELALRLAAAHTGKQGVVVIDGGYHGNSGALVGISPYKAEGPGGKGLVPWARKVPVPDPYRGRYRGADATGERYAAPVDEAIGALAAAGHPAAAFLGETILSCGGQVVPPAGYLEGVYRRVRAAGALCIADEVQTGFGRVGSHFWAFETQNVIPDIVVMGKPAGNGHPLGIVVTTAEIAGSFASGMEYFSTFGGNPVSCAIGLEVLDVIFDEDLQARALAIGHHLTGRLEGLASRHERIGDVRGRGLFLGVELVRDRESRAPDAQLARYAVDRLRDWGILVSTDGPDHNVIKIKPPLCFAVDDADFLVDSLDAILREDPARG